MGAALHPTVHCLLLNDEAIASPRAGKRGTGSWSPSAIRAILANPRYVGSGRYNQTQKLYRGGTKVREGRPAEDHVTYECPPIVGQAMFSTVVAIFAANERFGKANARKGAQPRHLLTGLSRCAVCGGPITVGKSKLGKINTKVYVCGWRRDRGASVCSNSARQPVAVVDAAVVEGVRRYLTPEISAAVIKELRSILKERLAQAPTESSKLASEAKTLKREIDRLTLALASTDDKPGAVIQAIAAREKRLRQVEAQLATLEALLSTVDLEIRRLEMEALKRLEALQREFDASPVHARNILGALTAGQKLQITPVNGRFRIEGPIAVPELLLSGTAVPDCGASPAGFEPASPT